MSSAKVPGLGFMCSKSQGEGPFFEPSKIDTMHCDATCHITMRSCYDVWKRLQSAIRQNLQGPHLSWPLGSVPWPGPGLLVNVHATR